MSRFKVSEYVYAEDYKLCDIITLDKMKQIMELVGCHCFTTTGYNSLLKVSDEFLCKILGSAVMYMGHLFFLDLKVEHVLNALRFHNLKFYGTGKMCWVYDNLWHPTEFLTTQNRFNAYDTEDLEPGSSYKRINLLENYKDEESGSEYEDILDDGSLSSSNLGEVIEDVQIYSREDRIIQTREELKDAQEALDELEENDEDEDDPLGESDDEEEIEASPLWVCDETGLEKCYSIELFGKGDSSSIEQSRLLRRRKRIFTRRDVDKIVKSRFKEIGTTHPEVTRPALAIIHQVFEDFLYGQLVDKPAPLGLEISMLNNKWKVQSLEKQVADLTRENQSRRKRMREASESLQSHFDVIDLAQDSMRRVSPS